MMNTRIPGHSCRIGAAVAGALLLSTWGASASASTRHISFDMQVSAGAKTCLPHARADVKIVKNDGAEDMYIFAEGLAPKTGYDLFVIQVPKAPFGLSWYQGDVESDEDGRAFQHFRGRFNIETFIVAPGTAPAPATFEGPFPDATENPATNPVQTYHLGLWFGSPEAAQKAGCPATVTPFNGEHNAGIQVLNTAEFPDTAGPLLGLK